MPARKGHSKYTHPAPPLKACEADGCADAGEYRAPKSPDKIYDYQWFCLDHIKEYNKKWNYFSDMSMAEIEDFMKEAVTGHRPTWEREDNVRKNYANYAESLKEEVFRFMHGRQQSDGDKARAKIPDSKERRALALLNITPPCTLAAMKTRYRQLVKQYHPDLHQGDKEYADKFKEITAAYKHLLELYKLR